MDEHASNEQIIQFLTTNPHLYELIMNLLACTVRLKRSLLNPFPRAFIDSTTGERDWKRLEKCIDTMPSYAELRNGDIPTGDDVLHLMGFIVQSNARVGGLTRVKGRNAFTRACGTNQNQEENGKNKRDRSPDHIFLLSNASDTYSPQQQHSSSVDLGQHYVRTIRGFHGSRTSSFWSILCNGISVSLSGTDNMANGEVHGKGAYFCEDYRVSRSFARAEHGWAKSSLLGTRIALVLCCDIVSTNAIGIEGNEEVNIISGEAKDARYIVAKRSDCIVPRCVLVYSHAKNAKSQRAKDRTSVAVVWLFAILLLFAIVFSNRKVTKYMRSWYRGWGIA